MNSINNKLANQNNVGSLRRILFIPVASLNAIPLLTDGVLDLRDVSIDGWYYSDFVRETPSANSDADYVTQGRLYKDEIVWKVARSIKEHDADFFEMLATEFFVAVQDNNDVGNFFGKINIETGEKSGMRFNFKKTSGTAWTDLNHYELKFYWQNGLAAVPCDHFSSVVVVDARDIATVVE